MTMQLRPVVAADLPQLARLHAACFLEDRWDEKALAQLLAMPGASGHLVEDVARNLLFGFILDLVIAANAEVLTLGVAPAWRRQGVARVLLEDLFDRAGRAGAAGVGLEVAADNAAALRLYEDCGFAHTGRRLGYYRRAGGLVDAMLFRRALL
jgi:[ribosomal protein S18]-alanine N-acetyltransferase